MSGSDFEGPDDDRLYRDPHLVDFYDLENGWGKDDDYCLALAASASSVLDLGCGTGRLATALASKNRIVVGVDPGKAMLDVARAKKSGDAVTWIEGDARELGLDREFDLVLLTGHAFQVFLSEADQRAVLKTVAKHLAPNGRFIFDSRNPLAEEWLEWGPENSRRKLIHPQYGAIEAWNTAMYDKSTNNVTYSTNYLVSSTGRLFTAESHIHFTPQSKLAKMIKECGLEVDQWIGDWIGNSFEAHSPEIIPIGRLRK
jgi:ubiquinone/menaquinone biosynthesis C-methylase UbiE